MAQLSYDQLRFLAAMAECSTKAEAADAIGVKRDTVYHWPDIVDDALRLMATDRVEDVADVFRTLILKSS